MPARTALRCAHPFLSDEEEKFAWLEKEEQREIYFKNIIKRIFNSYEKSF